MSLCALGHDPRMQIIITAFLNQTVLTFFFFFFLTAESEIRVTNTLVRAFTTTLLFEDLLNVLFALPRRQQKTEKTCNHQ